MSEANAELTALFLEFSRNKLLQQYWPRLHACVEPLNQEQVWWRPNQASNSIGNSRAVRRSMAVAASHVTPAR